jgi:hypothetical protein
MNNDAKKYYSELKSVFGMPQVYKGLELFPLKIKDFMFHEQFYQLFTYPQSSLSSKYPEIFKMSYLKFLFYVLDKMLNPDQDPDKSIEKKLQEFMNYITHRRDIKFSKETIGDTNFFITMKVGRNNFTENDFKNIREIILEQNGISIDFVEEYNEMLERDLEFLHKDIDKYDFKDQIFALGALLHKDIKDIESNTLYQMKNLLESASNLQAYLLQTIPLTEAGENYKFQQMIKHLGNKSRYAEVLKSDEEFKAETSYFKSDKDIAGK